MKPTKKFLTLFAILIISPFMILTVYSAMNRAKINQQLNQVEKDWDKLVKAMADYGNDRCGYYYPPDTIPRRKYSPNYPLTFECDYKFIYKETVGNKDEGYIYEGWQPLTTPVAYIEALPLDPFYGNSFYGYCCWNYHDGTLDIAMLYSPGPDGKETISLIQLRNQLDSFFHRRKAVNFDLTLEERALVREWISPYLYDPTNGLVSSGDLIWLIPFNTTEQIYGWKRLTWSDIPLSESSVTSLKEYANLLETWTSNDRIPDPLSKTEKIKRNQIIKFSSHIWKSLAMAGVINRDNMDKPFRLNRENLFKVQNHLGKDFSGFFIKPYLFKESDNKALLSWQSENPKWWNAVSSNIQKEKDAEIIREDLFTILPIFGKSQILLAAQECYYKKYDQAYERLINLRDCIESLRNKKSVNEPIWYEIRVISELDRLSLKLQNLIDEQRKAKKSDKT